MTNSSKKLIKKRAASNKGSLRKKDKSVKKHETLKRYLLIVLQALFGALIGACFFIYHITSQSYLIKDNRNDVETPSFYSVSKDYYESDNFKENLESSIEQVVRYVAIREQMEEKGVFSERKKVNIGEYSKRFTDVPYEGIDVEYYLDDLIKWGQRASTSGFSYCTYNFFTLEEYCEFFNLDFNTMAVDTPIEKLSNYTSFEVLKNTYLTVDGLNLENYVDNEDDYLELVNFLQSTCNDLYSNYVEYIDFRAKYSSESTNLRYAAIVTVDGSKTVFTNDSSIIKGATEGKIEEVFSSYGKYICVCPGKIFFNTNTNVEYDFIKDILVDEYGYSFNDDTKFYFGIDTEYPVGDVFALNKQAFENTKKIIPWIVSFGAAFLIGFAALGVVIVTNDKKRYSNITSKNSLNYFDKLPIEITFLGFVLLILILYLGESYTIKSADRNLSFNKAYWAIPAISLLFFDIFVILLFIYGFIKRFICKNVLEGSFYSFIAPKLFKYRDKAKRLNYRLYDQAGVALRTWSIYVVFLLFNVFWALMLFFSNHPFISFVVLFSFDVAVGVSLFNRSYERNQIIESIGKISSGDYKFKINTEKLHGDNKDLAEAVNEIGQGLSKAVEISTKDEKLKADLITNVSHDIKTPLTSIINYVDLLKRTNIQDENAAKYISILEEKTQRLKQLTFDLVEASKISSGNISIELIKIDFVEFLKQVIGEFEEKFEEKQLKIVLNAPEKNVFIMADPRHMFRVVENLFNNIYKYALPDTRVYLDLVIDNEGEKNIMILSLKNISANELNIEADELTERFIRGDVSRSTEGSGLGLSIAKNLTKIQNGIFEIYLDGDLFKVTLAFELVE